MEDTFERLLERLKTEGTIDATGVRIGPKQLAGILDAAPEDPDRPGRSLFRDAKFDGATFAGKAEFGEVTFQGEARFSGTTFEENALFNESTFDGMAWFAGASFHGGAWFNLATFQGDAWFEQVVFHEEAMFHKATFQGLARFGGTTFDGEAVFSEATFENARDFGPVLARHMLDFDRTVFAQPIRIEASAEALSCARARFRGGADVFVRRAEVALDDADFAEQSVLAPGEEPVLGGEEELRGGHDRAAEPAPRVVSVRRAKVANLTIAGADLRACRFEGAHGLDRLRLERVRFAQTPFGWRPPGCRPEPTASRSTSATGWSSRSLATPAVSTSAS